MSRPHHNHSENNDKPFSILTRLLLVMVPILILIGVYSYKDVFGNFIFNTTILRQQAGQNIDLDYGLVAHYTFDGPDMDWSSTTAEVTDTSGNGNNGNLVNSSAAATTLGKTGQAMSFDGVNQIISAPYSVTFNSLPITISTWFKGTSLGTGNLDSNNNGWDLYKVSNGVTCSYLNTWNNRVYDETNFVIPSSQIFNNNWHFITCVIDSTGGKLYLDGILIKQLNWIGTPSSSASNLPLHIGQRGYYTTFTNGVQDDVRIYNRALSADEVYKLYTEGKPNEINAKTSQGDTLTEGLVGYWKLDEGSGTTVADSSGNNNTGTASNTPTWTTGKIDGALSFNGTNQYVSVPGGGGLNNLQKGTVSMWVRWNGTQDAGYSNSSYGDVLGRQKNTVFTNNLIGLDGSNPVTAKIVWKPYVYNTTAITSTQSPGDAVWHHIVVVYTSGDHKMYIDGVLDATGNTTGTMNNDTSVALTIGAWIDTGGSYSTSNIDEVRIYNRALTQDEVARLYRTTTPNDPDTSLVGHWTFDGPDISGTTAYDRSSYGNNGTLTNGPTKTIGKLGQGMSFDGVNDFIATISSTFITNQAQPNSFLAWVYPRATSSTQSIISYGQSDDNNWSTALGLYGSNRYATWLGNGTNANSIAISSLAVPLNQWSFVGVVSSSTQRTFYVNNTSETISCSGVCNSLVSSDPFTIGATYYASGRSGYFSGNIDDIRAYNRALSADEIADMYSKGEGNHINVTQTISGDPLENGLVGHWTFDGPDMLTTTTTRDRSTTHATGTLTNGPKYAIGKIGQGIRLDGSDDYINGSNVTSESTTYTTSIWFKIPKGSLGGQLLTRSNSANCFYNPSIYVSLSTGVYVSESGCSNDGVIANNVGSLAADTWYQLTEIRNGTQNTTYLNGSLLASRAFTPACSGTCGSPAGKTVMGAQWQSVSGFSNYFGGIIDDVRIYNRALSAAEVEELYNRGK